MSQLQQALAKLEGVKPINGGYVALCPCHADRVRSLSISEGDDGKLLIYCHAGCSFVDIVRKLDLKYEPQEGKREVAHYDYVDARGNLQFQVVRFEPKGFSQRRLEDGKWVWDRKGTRPLLYNLPAVIEAKKRGDWICQVEGEKDVMTLMANDIVATTTPGGASNKWQPEFTAILSGAKIAIIPDLDDAGRQYAERIANALYGFVSSLKVIKLDAKDVTDWFQIPDHTAEKLLRIIENSPEYTPPDRVSREEFESLRMMVGYLNKRINRAQGRVKRYKYE